MAVLVGSLTKKLRVTALATLPAMSVCTAEIVCAPCSNVDAQVQLPLASARFWLAHPLPIPVVVTTTSAAPSLVPVTVGWGNTLLPAVGLLIATAGLISASTVTDNV